MRIIPLSRGVLCSILKGSGEIAQYYCEQQYGAFGYNKTQIFCQLIKIIIFFSADSQRGHLLGYEMWFNSDPDLQFPMMIAMDPPKHNVQRRADATVGSENLERMTIAIRNNVVEILDSLRR